MKSATRLLRRLEWHWRSSIFLKFWFGMSLLALLTSSVLLVVVGISLGNHVRSTVTSPALRSALLLALEEVGEFSADPATCMSQIGFVLWRAGMHPQMDPATLRDAAVDGQLGTRIVNRGTVVCEGSHARSAAIPALFEHLHPGSDQQSVRGAVYSLPGQPWGMVLGLRTAGMPHGWEFQLALTQPSLWNWQTKFQSIAWRLVSPHIFVLSLTLGSVLAMLLVTTLLRRIRNAERVARAWADGALDSRIVDHRPDEFGRLCQTFNVMAGNVQRLMRIGQTLAGAEERNILARELHDTAKQRSFALNIALTTLARHADTRPEQQRLIRSALELTSQLQQDLAAVLNRLGRSTPDDRNLDARLRSTLLLMLDGSAIAWRLSIAPGINETLQQHPDIISNLLAIATEGAANILRHSHAVHSRFALDRTDERISLTITDDGIGFDVDGPTAAGMGLVNMRQRTRKLPQGKFQLESRPGHGTRLTIDFHMPMEQ